ncbi:MAG: putative TIM-barrel fold metal-dependent hydrolase, partial [Gammaproteobacteria bacterium]
FLNRVRMMWANDFPHSDSTWPWSQSVLDKHLVSMTEAEKNLILHENVANLYKLDTSALEAAA